jgi:hypothetical protein
VLSAARLYVREPLRDNRPTPRRYRVGSAGERDQHGAAFNGGVVANGTRELEHHARTVPGLHDIDAPQIAFGYIVDVLAHRVGGIREVERDAGWVVDDESGGGICRRLFERHANDYASAGLRRHVHRFDGVTLGIRLRTST